MSVRMRVTRGKTGSRRSHHKVSTPRLTTQNGNRGRRHFVDPHTGTYRGTQVKDLAAKHQKRAERRAARLRSVREEQPSSQQEQTTQGS